ncbi:hypothetical protein ABEX47_23610 [Paenibacillus ehimensis]|uniref:hypothetical protein n=1 Tax=Paenibacillus ehimensis TaxID=79264 RepID=UPI003D2CD251
MNHLNRHIWIEAEQWEISEWNEQDCNSDVTVVFQNRSKWIASFFTYKNIQTLREKNMSTGECMNCDYYWSSDMVLIDFISRKRVEEVIEYLLNEDKFVDVFTRYPDVNAADDYLYPVSFFDS